jgi:prepilin-type N-terminal cleavage/methylation domain-containing protein
MRWPSTSQELEPNPIREGRSQPELPTRRLKPGLLAHKLRAFTLIELMVVIAVIGIIASIAIPALKGLGQANRSAATDRQILDDLAFARLRALNDRAPVYMVFVPANVGQALTRPSTAAITPQGKAERSQLTNLLATQFSAYALIAERTVGDQPGRHTRRYLTEWKTLPEGTLFAPYKLAGNSPNAADEYSRTFAVNLPSPLLPLPFPSSRSQAFPLPYLAYNAQGQLMSQRDEILTLAKGSVFLPRNPDGSVAVNALADVQLNPPVQASRAPRGQTNTYQFVRINWLTGRAKIELQGFGQ